LQFVGLVLTSAYSQAV